jgi:hypothetical protein
MLAFLTTPHALTGLQHLLLLCPLCIAISVVYKTIRCPDLGKVPLAAAIQSITIIAGMLGVGVAVWLVYLLLG